MATMATWVPMGAAIVGSCTSAMAAIMAIRQATCVARGRSLAARHLAASVDARLRAAVEVSRRSPTDEVAFEELVLAVRASIEGMPKRWRKWVLHGLDRDSRGERRAYVARVTAGVETRGTAEPRRRAA